MTTSRVEFGQDQGALLFQSIDFGFDADQKAREIIGRCHFEVVAVEPLAGK